MVRYTCDLCGKEMRPKDDCRYVVEMQIYPAHDPAELTAADLDQDHIEEISKYLQELEAKGETASPPEPTNATFRFDLCPTCQKKFLRNPLNQSVPQKLHFSEN